MTNGHNGRMTSTSGQLGRATALGFATGLRSTAGVGALVLRRNVGVGVVLSHPAARRGAGLAVGAELVADKLPVTGSRLAPPALAARVLLAGLGAFALARSERGPLVPAVIVSSAAALAGAKAGHDARAALSRRLPPTAVALAEDGLAIGLAAFASG